MASTSNEQVSNLDSYHRTRTQTPTIEANVSTNATLRVEEKGFDYIFSFNTGHEGAHILGNPLVYNSPSHVAFIHEHQDMHTLTASNWAEFDFDDEYMYVQHNYFPYIREKKGSCSTAIDFGHHNLYFVNALVKFLIDQSKSKFLFLRVTRDRYEAAKSMVGKYHSHEHDVICRKLEFRLCPFDRVSDVIIKVPSQEIWNNLTNIQRALWFIDEAEARWQKLAKTYPQMAYKIVHIDPSKLDTLEEAVKTVAKLANIDQGELRFNLHHSLHKEHNEKNSLHFADFSHSLIEQDNEYRKIFGITS